MPLIFLGSVDAASDATMATVTNQANSLFRTALEALIAAVLAENQAVIDAAEQAAAAAVNDALTTRLALSKTVYIEAGQIVWDTTPGRTLATHYFLPDHTGELVARLTPFPTPSATTPFALDW